MLAIARAIIGQRTGKFDPSRFRDRYQESLRELIEAKMKGLPIKPREISSPAPVIDLMAALKRNLVQDPRPRKVPRPKNAPKQRPIDARERCCCPCRVVEKRKEEPAGVAEKRRKKA
jgi:DNA end-binding protein Ku